MPRVLCTALNTEEGPHFDLLTNAGFDVTVVDRTWNLYDPDQLLQIAQNYEGVIAGSEPWPHHVLQQLPQLRVLSRTGVGFDAIDLAACDELGIIVATTPGVNHHAVAEHALAMLLALSRGFPQRDQGVRTGNWQRVSAPRMMGRTLGVLGMGRIGQALIEKVAGFGLRVIGYDPYPNPEFCQRCQVQLLSLDDVLAQSDYLSLHLPVTPETAKIIREETMARMKPGAILVNTARGALVDEHALAAALASGQLRGAGLDVFEHEPLSIDSPLTSMSNVLLSPHVAGLDDESQFATLSMSADTIIQLSQGTWPADRIQNWRNRTAWTWHRAARR